MPPRRRGSGRSVRNPPRSTNRKDLAGHILKLPHRDGLRDHTEIPEGCYDHPVVILSAQAGSLTGNVVILILTSFGETNILDKIPSPKPRKAYLPISPTSPHPDTGARLFLEKNAVLRKKSYVNTRDKHTVPFDILMAYDRRNPHNRYVLTSESYQQLIDHAGFVPDVSTIPIALPASASNTISRIPPSPATPLLGHSGLDLPYRTARVPDTRIPLLNHSAHDPYITPSYTTPSYTTPSYTTPSYTTPSYTTPSYTTPQRCHSYIPPTARRSAQPPQPDTLPYYSRTPRHSSASNGGYDRSRQNVLWSFVALAILLVLFGASIFGLWSLWNYRAVLGHALLSGLSWAGGQIWRLAKRAVGAAVLVFSE